MQLNWRGDHKAATCWAIHWLAGQWPWAQLCSMYKAKEPYQSAAHTVHTPLGCLTRSVNLWLCLCIRLIKLAVCVALFRHWNLSALYLTRRCAIAAWVEPIKGSSYYLSRSSIVSPVPANFWIVSHNCVVAWMRVTFRCIRAHTHTQTLH